MMDTAITPTEIIPAAALDVLDAPDTTARAANLLLWTIAAFSGTALLWAGLARVDEVAQAQGKVIPSHQLQIVSNLEGGIVDAIAVKPGDHVAAGQVLLRLDKTQFNAELGRTSGSYDAFAARAARLDAETRGTPLAFPPDMAARAPAVIATERAAYTAQMADLADATSAARAKLDQAERARSEAEVEAATRAQAQTAAAHELAMIAPLVAQGIEPQIEALRAQSAVAQSTGARASADLAVRRAASAVAEAQAELRNVTAKFRTQATEQLAQTRADLASQREALPALADRVSRTELRAPVAGTVNRVLAATVGGTIRPGEPLVEIVPAGDRLVIEALVKPADIAFVHVGQKAFVKLSAYDYSVYGGLEGEVERIAPDATVNERTGESHFIVRVTTQATALHTQDGGRLPISAGMQAEVDMLGHKRSVLSYLLTPVSKLHDNAFREK
jgi:membrane fusion protein, adhesin transport system